MLYCHGSPVCITGHIYQWVTLRKMYIFLALTIDMTLQNGCWDACPISEWYKNSAHISDIFETFTDLLIRHLVWHCNRLEVFCSKQDTFRVSCSKLDTLLILSWSQEHDNLMPITIVSYHLCLIMAHNLVIWPQPFTANVGIPQGPSCHLYMEPHI